MVKGGGDEEGTIYRKKKCRSGLGHAHGLDPEVGEGAGDALPAAGVEVGGPPAGEALGGGVEGQLELEQDLACKEASKTRMRKKEGGIVPRIANANQYRRG